MGGSKITYGCHIGGHIAYNKIPNQQARGDSTKDKS